MLHDFLWKQDTEILFLQKGTHPNIVEVHGYRTYTNVEIAMRHSLCDPG